MALRPSIVHACVISAGTLPALEGHGPFPKPAEAPRFCRLDRADMPARAGRAAARDNQPRRVARRVRVLVVDESGERAALLREALTSAGHEVMDSLSSSI